MVHYILLTGCNSWPREIQLNNPEKHVLRFLEKKHWWDFQFISIWSDMGLYHDNNANSQSES